VVGYRSRQGSLFDIVTAKFASEVNEALK